jgi:hypothetical protein
VQAAPQTLANAVTASTSAIDNDYQLMVARLNNIYNSHINDQFANPDPTNNDGATLSSPLTAVHTLRQAISLSLETWSIDRLHFVDWFNQI